MAEMSPITPNRSDFIYRAGRWTWLILVALILTLTVIGVPNRYSQLLELGLPSENALENLGLSVPFYAFFGTALDLTIVLAHLAIAAFIFWRCTNMRVAVIVPIVLIAGGAIIPFTNMYGSRTAAPLVQESVNLILYLGLLGSIALLYLFPDGRFVPRWTRILAVVWAALAFVAVFAPDWPISISALPAGIRMIVLLAWSGSGIFAQVYRYNYVSNPVQKQQTKWGVFGLVLAVMGPIGFFFPLIAIPSFQQPEIPNFLYNSVGQNLFDTILLFQLVRFIFFTLAIILFPLSFAVAILRYRLWDIDIIIRRTLVYGALTVALAVVYAISVVLLQALFQAVSGERRSTFVTVISTLAIAALFVPFRQRVQKMIDRRFFRSKYDAAKALTAFSHAARDEVDIDHLTAGLLDVVQETVQPSFVSLWLKPTKETIIRNELRQL
jgi:hypothetical protein